jgi:putative transposase
MTSRRLVELFAADLSGLDLVAFMVGRGPVAEPPASSRSAARSTGRRSPAGGAEGATENATAVRDLLTGLRERGLDTTRPILCVLNGAKALRAVDDVSDHRWCNAKYLGAATEIPR